MKSLVSPKDVREERVRLLAEQKQSDALLGIPLHILDAVLDHDHRTQKVRGVLHRQTNAFLGKIENAHVRYLKWWCNIPLPRILRLVATYLEQDYSENNYHPKWIKACSIEFSKLPATSQKKILENLKDCKGNSMKIPSPNTSKNRRRSLEKFLGSKQITYDSYKGQTNAIISKSNHLCNPV